MKPFQGMVQSWIATQGALADSRPWALRSYAFGVKTHIDSKSTSRLLPLANPQSDVDDAYSFLLGNWSTSNP